VYQSADRVGGRECREERELECLVRAERHAANDVAERGAEQHRQEQARAGERDIPERAPQRVVHVRSELDRDTADDQRPQHEEHREIEA
jgi:hypothetical protein